MSKDLEQADIDKMMEENRKKKEVLEKQRQERNQRVKKEAGKTGKGA